MKADYRSIPAAVNGYSGFVMQKAC